MKFATVQDARRFLAEVGRIDMIDGVTESFEPTTEMVEEFIQHRRDIVPGLKDFRRSQQTKDQWRHNRSQIMKGINRFHKSTKGKRFHRALGRFLATRCVDKLQTTNTERTELTGMIGLARAEQGEALVYPVGEIIETLKALSSLRTHAFIELEYYRPLDEELEYRAFFDELLPTLDRIEKSLLSGSTQIDEEDQEFLLNATNLDELIKALAEQLGMAEEKVLEVIHTALEAAEARGLDPGSFQIELEPLSSGAILVGLNSLIRCSNTMNESHS